MNTPTSTYTSTQVASLSANPSSSKNVSMSNPDAPSEGADDVFGNNQLASSRASFSAAILNKIFTQVHPHQFTSSPLIDAEIQKLVTLLLRDYVASWFSVISDNDDFVTELIRTIAHVIRECERRLNRVDFIVLATRDLPEILKRHIYDYRHCCEKLGTSYGGGRTLDELFHGCQPHIALNDSASETEYLRGVADILLGMLLPETEHQNESVRYLLREILTNNVLAMLIDILADPDYLNHLFISLLDTEELDESPISDDHNYANSSPETNPDSPRRSSSFSYRDSNGIVSGNVEIDPNLTYGSDNDNEDTSNSVLFRVQATNNPFVRRRRQRKTLPPPGTTNPFVKFTMGGLEKMSNSIDKFKNLVTTRDPPVDTGGTSKQPSHRSKLAERRMLKRKQKAMNNDRMFEENGSFVDPKPSTLSLSKKSLDADQPISKTSPSMTKCLNESSQQDSSDKSISHSPITVFRTTDPLLSHRRPSLYESGASDSDTVPQSSLLQQKFQRQKGLSKKHQEQPQQPFQLNQPGLAQPELDSSEPIPFVAEVAPSNHTPPSHIDTDVRPTQDRAEGAESGIWSRLSAQFHEIWNYGYSLYHETRYGPWHLGPIDTTKYDRQYLEEPLLDFINEAFQIQTNECWILTQLMFFVKPILHSFATPFVNRRAFWPENIQAPSTYGVRSERDKQESKIELETYLVNLVSQLHTASYVPLLSRPLAEEQVRFLFSVFQSKTINKHLLFVVIDLILAHIAPEYAETRVSDD
ncbi:hypothetical protein BSLG_003144 [Batrachochytrium salamandrivorans]|nr:hypothetical protein BSLG_003144 [Batrachochytrium salamandrivorans]